jgi:hypothetical protein
MNTDPRLLKATIDKLPDRLQDLYRRGAYDALRSKLVKMKDGANIGAFLEDNPDIRDRVAALSKTPDDATALRRSQRRARDGRPKELHSRRSEHRRAFDRRQGDAAEGDGDRQHRASGACSRQACRRCHRQRCHAALGGSDERIMGEVGKIMTRTGEGIPQTFDEIQRLKANDAMQQLFADRLRGGLAGIGAARSRARRCALCRCLR